MSEPNFLDKYKQLRTVGLTELHEIWNHYDRDGSGYIEAGPELRRILSGGLEKRLPPMMDYWLTPSKIDNSFHRAP